MSFTHIFTTPSRLNLPISSQKKPSFHAQFGMPATHTQPARDSIHFSGKIHSKVARNLQVDALLQAYRTPDAYTYEPYWKVDRVLEPICPQEQVDILVQAFQQNRGSVLPLYTAIRRNHIDALTALINRGAILNQVDRYGHTPLHYAANLGRSKAIDTLVNAGANVNIRNAHCSTPFGLIQTNYRFSPQNRQEKYLDAAMHLLAHGAEPNQLTPEFDTQLNQYIQQHRTRYVEQLVSSNHPAGLIRAVKQFLTENNDLKGETPTTLFNQFIRNKEKELNSAKSDEAKHQILDRIQPLLREGIPVDLGIDLPETARILKRKDWLADAVQVDPSFLVTQAFLRLISPLYIERENARKTHKANEFIANAAKTTK